MAGTSTAGMSGIVGPSAGAGARRADAAVSEAQVVRHPSEAERVLRLLQQQIGKLGMARLVAWDTPRTESIVGMRQAHALSVVALHIVVCSNPAASMRQLAPYQMPNSQIGPGCSYRLSQAFWSNIHTSWMWMLLCCVMLKPGLDSTSSV